MIRTNDIIRRRPAVLILFTVSILLAAPFVSLASFEPKSMDSYSDAAPFEDGKNALYDAATAISTGKNFTLALKSDGTVWAWGLNGSGQLGDGTIASKHYAAQVKVDAFTYLTDITAVFAGGDSAFALKDDGTVWGWGYNNFGQLGDGTTTNRSYPVQVKVDASTYLTDVKEVSVGDSYIIVLKNDGTVWAWGYNYYGQLGDGTTKNKNYAVQVKANASTNLTGVATIAVGMNNSFAVKNDGTVWAWGFNDSGQLGDGTYGNMSYAVQVKASASTYLTGVKAVSGGIDYTIALKNDGTVWGWGYNYHGYLGDGTTTNRPYAVQVKIDGSTNLTGVKAIALTNNHSLALKKDGTVWGWGYNNYGQLGDGTTTDRSYAAQVMTDDSVSAYHTGIYAIDVGTRHSVAMKNDGTVWAWGLNSYGQLGDDTIANRSYAAQVNTSTLANLTDVIVTATGYQFTIALKNDGTVWAWGYNYQGQLGDGTRINKSYAVQVKIDGSTNLTEVISIAAGNQHAVAVKGDGTIWAWGYNYFGQIGDGTGLTKYYAVRVKADASTYLKDVIAATAGSSHSVALKKDGTVWAWGYNYYGQLGDGTTTDRSYPVQVMSGASAHMGGVKALSAGFGHTVALREDGTVWAWGYNYYGQLGDGTGIDKNYAVQVSTDSSTILTGAIAVEAGNDHTMALKEGGTVWAWGRNGNGQVGDGTAMDRYYAVQVKMDDSTYFTGVKAIAGGEIHGVALKEDGTVWAWGNNNYGQLGDGTTTKRSYAVQPKTDDSTYIAGVKAISGGYYRTTAVKEDGTVWSCGSNNFGQLGDGTTTNRSYATQATYHGEDLILFEPHILSITVTGMGGEASITSDGGTLQMLAEIWPADVMKKEVAWSIYSGSEYASISGSGLLTAVGNGNVTVRATAQDSYGVYGSTTISITGQFVPVVLINITGMSGETAITADGGSLQMIADVRPVDADNKDVTWSIYSGSEYATISESGLLTAVGNGNVIVRATARDGTGIYGSTTIAVSGQFVPVASISITGSDGSIAITTDHGSLQMVAEVLPADASS